MTKKIISISLCGILLIILGTLYCMIAVNTADALPRLTEYTRSRVSTGVSYSVYEKLPNESFSERLAVCSELDTQNVDDVGEILPVLVNENYFKIYEIEVDGSAIIKDHIVNHTPAVVISDKAAKALDADDSVIGRTITLYEKEFTIVGTYKKPAGYPRGLSSDFHERVYLPYTCYSGYQQLSVDTLAAPKGSYSEQALALFGMTGTNPDYYIENDIAIKHDIVANLPNSLIFLLTIIIAVYCIINIKRIITSIRCRLKPDYEKYTVPQIILHRKWYLLARLLIIAVLVGVPVVLLILFPPKLVLPLSYIPYDNIFDVGYYYNAFRSAVQVSNSGLAVGNLYYGHLFTIACITELVLFLLIVVLMLFTAAKLNAVIKERVFKLPKKLPKTVAEEADDQVETADKDEDTASDSSDRDEKEQSESQDEPDGEEPGEEDLPDSDTIDAIIKEIES